MYVAYTQSVNHNKFFLIYINFFLLKKAKSLLSEFRNASQLLNPVSLLKFDAVEIRSSKEGMCKSIMTIVVLSLDGIH